MKNNSKAIIQSVNNFEPQDKETAEVLDQYSNLLLETINEKNIYNVGLSGPYGSGKTTIVEKALKSCQISANKSVKISLGSYNSSATEIDSENLQLEIIKQIFAQARESELSGVTYKKIPKDSLARKLKNSFVLIAVLVLSFLFITCISNLLSLNVGITEKFIASIAVLLLALVPFLSDIPIKNIEFSGMKMETGNAEGESPEAFTHLFPELDYFIHNSPKRLFFFEDLDRISNSNIFTDLRNLNTNLNHSLRTKNRDEKVVFIYLVSDDFLDEEGTQHNTNSSSRKNKFFDANISIISANANISPWDYIEEQNNDLRNPGNSENEYISNLYKRFKNVSGYYLNDIRTIKHICNDIKAYKEVCSALQTKTDIRIAAIYFSLRNLTPTLFSLNFDGNSNIVAIFEAYIEILTNQEKRLNITKRTNTTRMSADADEPNPTPTFRDFDHFSRFIRYELEGDNKFENHNLLINAKDLYEKLYSSNSEKNSSSSEEKFINTLISEKILTDKLYQELNPFLYAPSFSRSIKIQDSANQEDEEEIRDNSDKLKKLQDILGNNDRIEPKDLVENLRTFKFPGNAEIKIAEEIFYPTQGLESVYYFFEMARDLLGEDKTALEEFKIIVKDAYNSTKNKFMLRSLLELVLGVDIVNIKSNPKSLEYYDKGSSIRAAYSERSVFFKNSGGDRSSDRVYMYVNKPGQESDTENLIWIITDEKEIIIITISKSAYEYILNSENETNDYFYSYRKSSNKNQIIALDYQAAYTRFNDEKISKFEDEGAEFYLIR